MPGLEITVDQLDDLGRGCAVLGTGGGGDPQTGVLMALQAIQEHGSVPLVDLDDLPDEGLVMPCGGLGAPTVSIEKFGNGDEGRRLRDRVEALLDRPVVALMASEIGGSNGLVPIAWAAGLRLPVVDADGMGRAFPEMQQVTMHLAGISPSPAVLTDERGNVLVLDTVGGRWIERLARAVAVELGARASSTEYLLSAAEARKATVRGSVSLALRIGRVIREARSDKVGAVTAEVSGHVLIEGKIVDVERRTTGGFARGTATIEGLGGNAGRTLLSRSRTRTSWRAKTMRVLASVPDLITILDTETAETITTERLRYGQRVSVIAFPCDPIWRTEQGNRDGRAARVRLRLRLLAGRAVARRRRRRRRRCLTFASGSTSGERTPTP